MLIINGWPGFEIYQRRSFIRPTSISVTRKQQVYIKRLYRHSVSMYHIVQELEEGGFDIDCKQIMQRKHVDQSQ